MSWVQAGPPVLQLRDVWRTFAGVEPVYALRQVNLVVDRGEYLAIVGPSGSGKSTLLNVLGLLDRPTAGDYFLDGFDTTVTSEADRTMLRATRLGFVFQSFHLLNHRSALENVMFGGLYQGVPRRERKDRALAALNRVGLSHRVNFLPDLLSGGERQRVAVARALASEPSILLCDEPTGNLDSVTTGSILDLFDELVTDGMTMCVITHEPDVAERAHRRVQIIDGQLSEEQNRSRDPWVGDEIADTGDTGGTNDFAHAGTGRGATAAGDGRRGQLGQPTFDQMPFDQVAPDQVTIDQVDES